MLYIPYDEAQRLCRAILFLKKNGPKNQQTFWKKLMFELRKRTHLAYIQNILYPPLDIMTPPPPEKIYPISEL